MNGDDRPRSPEPAPDEPERDTDAPRGIARFMRYTSPIMLAMLAPTGKSFAGS